MRLVLPPALVLLASAALCAQDPPAPKSVDAIAGKITEIDKQTAELAKQRTALVGDLKVELKRIADLVEKLNLNGPVPPQPTPPVPVPPVDPLKAKLTAAFDSDPADPAARKSQALDLAALYRAAAKLTLDPTVQTTGQLLERKRTAANTLVGADALKEVRRAVQGELATLMPVDAPLTDDQRATVAALFAKLAATLEEIAKP